VSGQVAAVSALDVVTVRDAVEEHFPGLWPAVEVGLSVCATLLLADNSNPVAVIYVGPPSSSKTTVADMFAGHPLCYRSDNFTPAAFVSHAANRSPEALKKVDLLPRIRHKVLVTPELGTIFRGKEEDLVNQFKIITRILDGQGLLTDSGTHGQRGYEGDYLFAWLGCTTPFDAKVWKVMAQLGSRLFFLVMDTQAEVTDEDLVASIEGLSYGERLVQCKGVVHGFITALFDTYGGVRGVTWDTKADPLDVHLWIARLAKLLAAMRSEPERDGESGCSGPGFIPARPEQPYRAHAVLNNLARGHALIHGRTQLTEEDLPLVARVTISTMPTKAGLVFAALVRAGGNPLTVAEAQAALGVRSPETVRGILRDLNARGAMEFIEAGSGKPAELRFRPHWKWCASPEALTVIWEGPVKNPGVCAGEGNPSKIGGCLCVLPPSSLSEFNLAQLRREKERGMMHTPPPKNDRFEWSQFGARGAGPGTRGMVPALPDPARVAALREGRQQKEKTMVKHDDDESGREGLDGVAGTPLGKLLGIGDDNDKQKAGDAMAGYEALMKVLGLGDDGKIREDGAEQPKRETLSRAEIVQVVKAAQHNPRVRAALGKLQGIAAGQKVGGDDAQKTESEVEKLARNLEKAGAVELARLIRGGRK